MAIKNYKPTTPGRRFSSAADFSMVTTSEPHKPLTYIKKKSGGRNSYGRITSRYIGGGHKQRVRLIDFKRMRHNELAEVITIEYDPGRSARIALVQYEDGQKAYILMPNGLKVGDKVMSGAEADVKVGNNVQIKRIPPGTQIHNIELVPGQGGKIVRSAGSSATIMSKDREFSNLKLPSGEVRMVRNECYATIGQVSNTEHNNVVLGKAGRKRWMGKTSRVRGVAKNPVDHPMGGGEGKTSGGRHPCSPWGQLSKGLKTRKRYKASSRYIVKDRRKK